MDVVDSARVGDSEVSMSLLGVLAPPEDSKKKGKRGPNRRVRFDAETMARIFQTRLSQNICRYRGFVLDGFPKSYEECKSLFLKVKTVPEIASTADGGQDESDTTQDVPENATGLELDSSVTPDFVISLSASPETCEKRLMCIPAAAVIALHNDREGFRRRLQNYLQQNESVEGRPKTTDFFQVRALVLRTRRQSLSIA